jgi:hypothetical protein
VDLAKLREDARARRPLARVRHEGPLDIVNLELRRRIWIR